MRQAKSQWRPSSREMSSFENGGAPISTTVTPTLTYPNVPDPTLIAFGGLVNFDKGLALIPHFVIDLQGPR